MKLKDFVNKINKYIVGTKFENNTFIVGGAVRDFVMNSISTGKNIESNDFDLCVRNGLRAYDLCKMIQEKMNQKNIDSTIVNFEDFGSIRFHSDELSFEITDLRKETYEENSRKPKITLGKNIEDDAKRRDFTINAIYYNVSNGNIIDPLNGINDIKNKILRSCDDPDKTFYEDPLRILRAIRFSKRFNFEISKNTLSSMLDNGDRLKIVSIERIKDELKKIIYQIEKENGTAQSRFELLSMLDSIDFFKNFIPELEELKYIPFNTVYHTCNGFIHSLDVFSKIETILIPDDLYFEVFIAALLHDVGKINTTRIDRETLIVSSKGHDVIGAELSKEILKRLKFSNKEIDLISKIIKSHMFFKQFNSNDEIKEKTLRKFAKRFNFKEELICCAIAVIVADEKSHKLTSNIDFYKLLDDLGDCLVKEYIGTIVFTENTFMVRNDDDLSDFIEIYEAINYGIEKLSKK